MDVQLIKHEISLQQWSEMIRDRQSSGMTVKAWCKEQGMNPKTYYYRLRKVREAACLRVEENSCNENAGPVFAEVRRPSFSSGAAVTLRMNGVALEIHNGAGADVIKNTLKALSQLC